ncbi:MAG: hypothetical protein LBQ12_07710, partial [Deltaproteobacteria bacterium]|nr:hypothetical protein [Deltaproteobacteria bacterium]
HLPYTTQLIPLAVIFSLKNLMKAEGKVYNESEVNRKLSAWYWCGVLGELYHSSNETRFVNDVAGMMGWLDETGELPDTIQSASFRPTRLLTLKTRNSAAYKGITALILKDGARDFLTGEKVEREQFHSGQYDIHHIFPKSYCDKENIPESLRDCIVNKTAISSTSNKTIGGSAPSKYLKKLVCDGHVTEAEIREFVSTHKVDVSFLDNDDFHGFFISRAKSLVELVAKAMGKPVEGLDGEEVKKAFGASLA